MTTAAEAAVLLRAEIDAVLADWAYHLDHGQLDELAALFTEDALFVTGRLELRGRAQIKNRYLERTVVRSTRHTYSGLRVSALEGAPEAVTAEPADGGPPGRGARVVNLGQLRGQRGAAGRGRRRLSRGRL